MKALVYLLGARALDIARNASEPVARLADVSPGPLATTPETAAAWRRWSQAVEADGSAVATAPMRRARSEPAASA